MSALTRFNLSLALPRNANKGFLHLLLLLALSLLLLNSLHAQAKPSHQHNLFGSHGMVLFYDQHIGLIASHLPLYSTPHHYQIIYKISIDDPVLEKQLVQLFESGMVTMLPERFDLTQLVRGEQFTIGAGFFKGHFERGGERVFNTKMRFEQAVLIKQVAPEFTAKQASFYQVALNDNTTLVVHQIQAAPSFDAIGLLENSGTAKPAFLCKRPDKSALTNIAGYLVQCAEHNALSVTWHYTETQDFQHN